MTEEKQILSPSSSAADSDEYDVIDDIAIGDVGVEPDADLEAPTEDLENASNVQAVATEADEEPTAENPDSPSEEASPKTENEEDVNENVDQPKTDKGFSPHYEGPQSPDYEDEPAPINDNTQEVSPGASDSEQSNDDGKDQDSSVQDELCHGPTTPVEPEPEVSEENYPRENTTPDPTNNEEARGSQTPSPTEKSNESTGKLDAVEDELDYGYDDDLPTADCHHANDEQLNESAQQQVKEEAEESEEDGEIPEEEEGEVKEEPTIPKEEPEDGEIEDPYNKPHLRSKPCRFFLNGCCTWGYNCRFLHPGVNDKGNYRLLTRPGFEPPEKTEGEEKEKSRSPSPPAPPKPETAWERGLRQAKEALKRASRKKEMELDIEDKKMNLSLNDLENKENERKYRDPYYDSLQYDDLDPIQATSYYDNLPKTEQEPPEWQNPGAYEDFDVQWTQANYDLPHNDRYIGRPLRGGPPPRDQQRPRRGGRTPPNYHNNRHPSPSFRYDWRQERDMGDPRGQQQRHRGQDSWVDPWQRPREKPLAHRGRPHRRANRRARSGSDSSFSSPSGSSRSGSASSFSSMSSRSRSRTRTPTPLRNAKPRPPRPSVKTESGPPPPHRQQHRGPPPRDNRRGPEWAPGPPPRDRAPAPPLGQHWQPRNRGPGGRGPPGDDRMSRRDQPNPGRRGADKLRRHKSSSSSSGSSDSSRSSSNSSRSSSSSSSGSSSSDSGSDSDSDALYAGMSKAVPKDKKKRPDPSPTKTAQTKTNRKSADQKDPLKASVSQIKLTIVNKSKVQPKKRLLESSPPPESEQPQTKKAAPDRSVTTPAEKQGKSKTSKPVQNSAKTRPSATQAAGTSKSPAAKPAAAPPKPAAGAKKAAPNRREELLKQLKAVEDAIAKKRSKT